MVIVSMLLLTRLKGGLSGKGWININQLDLTSHSLILHQCREHVQVFAMIKAAFARIIGGTRLILTRWSLQNDLSWLLPGYSRRIPCSAGCFCALIKQLTLLGRGTAISGSHPFCGSAVWYHPQCHYLHTSRPLVFDISLVVPH